MVNDEKEELRRLREESDLLKREIEIITALNSKITVDMDIERFMDEIVYTIREKVDFDGCNIAIIDDKGFMLVHKISQSRMSKKNKASGEFLERIFSQRLDYKVSNDSASRVARENAEIHCPEVRLDEFSPDERDLLENYGITSFYYLPISLDGRVLGVMRFHNYVGTMHLSEFEKDLIRKRADIVARALANHRLYTELKKKNDIIRLDNELAERIQRALVPRSFPRIEGVSIAAEYLPMLEVGGDYYDFIISADGSRRGMGAIITDASGHGVSAAFITTMLKMIFQNRRTITMADRPCEVMDRINAQLRGRIADNFVTGVYCYFDLESMEVRAAGCGHHPVLVIDRNDKSIVMLSPSGRVLGLFDDLKIEESRLDLHHGLRFMLYTDGLIEATDRNGDSFHEKLLQLCREGTGLETRPFIDSVIDALKSHSLYGGRRSLEDDTALAVIDIL